MKLKKRVDGVTLDNKHADVARLIFSNTTRGKNPF